MRVRHYGWWWWLVMLEAILGMPATAWTAWEGKCWLVVITESLQWDQAGSGQMWHSGQARYDHGPITSHLSHGQPARHHQITLMTFIRLRHDIQGGTRLNISIQNHPNLCSNNEVWDNVDNVCTTDIELLSSYSCMTSSCQYGYLPICYASIHCLRYNKLLLEFDPRLIGTVATAGSSLATVFYRATDFSQNISIWTTVSNCFNSPGWTKRVMKLIYIIFLIASYSG